MTIKINDKDLAAAAGEGMDQFLGTIIHAFKQQVGEEELNVQAMQQLSADQITLWGYMILRDELMDGGFVQLIYNGYGPFFFDNPFAKAMRLWGLHDFSKLLYKAKKVYDEHKADLTKERSDEDFMALFEQYPEFDDLDDEFVEEEENITSAVAYYVDEHMADFVEIVK
uniref:DMP19 family protein n=1 Tax=Alloprevotella sp. TaxID=1872471 RepID=UPI0015AD0E76